MNALTEQVIARLNALVVVLDEKGQAEYVSPTALPLLGFHPEQLLGDNWLRLTRETEEEKQLMLQHLRLLYEGKTEVLPYERRLKTAFGGSKWILWNSCFGGEGKVIGIGYDISERKHREEQLQKRTADLDERNREMEASLRYAQRIQSAILPSAEKLKTLFADAFVHYKPKDIVSGDFWWLHEKGDSVYVAAVDCTGHGVPGALMSVLAHSVFREVFINKALSDPAEILHAIDQELFLAFRREDGGEKRNDGLDVALCRFIRDEHVLQFAGAFRPLFHFRGDTLNEIPAGRYPIGYYETQAKKFETKTVQLEKGDRLYIFSDGYADQFGGEHGKKLKKSGFVELLHTVSEMTMEEQEAFLDYASRNWRQEEPQTDDILVIGISV